MRTWLLIFGILCGCTRAPQRAPEAGSVSGVRPGTYLGKAVSLLGPGKSTEPPFAEGGPAFEFAEADVICSLGTIERVRAKRFDYGDGTVRSGDTKEQAERLLGPAQDSFQRGTDVVWNYEIGNYRYQATLGADKLQWIDIEVRPDPLPRQPADYGVGTYGQALPRRIRLAVGGVGLGLQPNQVEQLKGPADPRLTGDTLAYGTGLMTLVTYDGKGVRSIIGQELSRDGAPWLKAGVSLQQAQAQLASLARLRSQSAHVVCYTFLADGEVAMRVARDQTVERFELRRP